MREAVYQRARAALARQLTAVDPPLSTEEIESQHQELEDAVARLEAEFAPEEEPAASFEEPPPKEEPVYAAPEPEPRPMTEPEPEPQPVAQRRAPAPPLRDDEFDHGGEYDDDEDDEEYEDDDERPSRLPLLIGIAVVVLVLVGAGSFLYSQSGTILGLFGGQSGSDVVAAGGSGAASPADDASDKRPDRLINGADAPIASEPPADQVTLVQPADSSPPADAGTAQLPQTSEPLSAVPSDQTATLQQPAPDTNLVEQRAIYYFQGSEGQPGQASEGAVNWVEISKDGRPAIQATLGIPERNVTATVTIYKNFDSSLPASHLVEIQFSGALGGSPIQRVPALVLKQTEQARGQPLAGAAVPVTNELFWIALSDDQEQVERNVQLLREGSWFDIPILFDDQTRALLTFEKGIPGDKVFETVMATWTPN